MVQLTSTILMSPTQSLNGGGLYMNIPIYTTPRTACSDIHIDARQEANLLTIQAPEKVICYSFEIINIQKIQTLKDRR